MFVMTCRNCGKFTRKGTRGTRNKYCDRLCQGLHSRGRTKYGDRSEPSRKEYIQIRREDGTRVYYHRWIYEQENGPIPEGMIVHHRNEIKRCNDPENLGLMKQNEHTPNAHFHWRTRHYTDGGFVRVRSGRLRRHAFLTFAGPAEFGIY